MRVEIGNAVLYHGDCMEVVADLPDSHVIVSDPPYGMGWNTDSTGYVGGSQPLKRPDHGLKWPRVVGDDAPFDPAPFLRFRRVVLFGSNHFGQRLPVGATLVWLKKPPQLFGTMFSDAEIAWMKGGDGVRCHFSPGMNGYIKARAGSYHPTQKPVDVMAWCLTKVKATPSDTVVDPYMGSGTTGVACAQQGIPFIGVEMVREYFDIACERIERAQAQLRLAI